MFNNNVWQQQQIAMILQSQYQAQLQVLQQQQRLQQQQQQQPQQHFFPNNNGRIVDAIVNLDDSDKGSDDDDSDDKRTLFIANLDEQVTEELLYELFLQAGPLDAVRIPKDNMGKQRTFGFVVYLHQCSIPYALELFDGLKLFRRAVTLKPKLNNIGNNSGKQRISPMGMSSNMGNGMHNNPFNLPQTMVPNYNEETARYARDRNMQRERERDRDRDYDRRYNHGHGKDRQRRQQQPQQHQHPSNSTRRSDPRPNSHKRM